MRTLSLAPVSAAWEQSLGVFARVTQPARAFGAWWVAELQSLVREWRGQSSETTPNIAPVQLYGDQRGLWHVGPDDARQLRAATAPDAALAAGEPTHPMGLRASELWVPKSDALARVVTVPAAAAPRFEDMLALNWSRWFPLAREDVLVNIVRGARDAGQIPITVWLLKRSDWARWQAQAASAGSSIATLRVIETRTEDGALNAPTFLSGDFLASSSATDDRRRYGRAALAAVAAILLALWLTMSWLRQVQTQRVLATALAQVHPRAERVRAQMAAVEREQAWLLQLAALARRPSASLVLTDVQRVVPTALWIEEADLRDQTLRLEGDVRTLDPWREWFKDVPSVAAVRAVPVLEPNRPASLNDRVTLHLTLKSTVTP